MQLLQQEQMWVIARARQEEMLREAEQVRLARAAQGQQPNLWQRMFHRNAEQPAAFTPEAAPELG